MKFEITYQPPQPGRFKVQMDPGDAETCRRDMVTIVMNSRHRDDDHLILENSKTGRRWEFDSLACAVDGADIEKFILERVWVFDTVYCQSLQQAESLVQQLEQLLIVNALRANYTGPDRL